MTTTATTRPPRIGFVLEQVLGHATHADNLRRILPDAPEIEAEIVGIPWEVDGLGAHVPLYNSNWTVRAGLRARRAIGQMHGRRPLDGLFIHTQVPAVLAGRWLRRIPTVVSVDASPLQYDELGSHYGHEQGHARVEQLKWRASKACFDRAVHLVSWSAWAKTGLVEGYGVDADKVTVIPPGVTPSAWSPNGRAAPDGPVRILFVGGDLQRKGGDLLVDAFQRLRAGAAANTPVAGAELHLVTKAEVPELAGVTVHNDLQPNDPALVELYRSSHIFCLPTRGDCLPMALSEAGAAELALVSTAVAGVPEIVRDGETGVVVPPDDPAALEQALRALVEAPQRRRQLGANARRLVERDFDAGKNAAKLVELLVEASRSRS